MRYIRCLILALALPSLLPVCNMAGAEDDWRDKTLLLVYAPRYFGPNAFPIPELRSGKAPSHAEVEVRGEYHAYTGDKTRNLYLRALIPAVKGRAGIEVRFVALEQYRMTPEVRDERHAAELESPPNESGSGDVVISAFYQLLQSDRWIDAMCCLNLKTASGGRLCDARFTDAATYWIDITLGKDILKSRDRMYRLRVQAMSGFYCWMTNDMVHRQNDAILYGAGITATLRRLTLSSDLSGFSGYKHNGDQPLLWRNSLQLEYRRNVLSLRYTHGMKDSLYDTYSIGYIRKF